MPVRQGSAGLLKKQYMAEVKQLLGRFLTNIDQQDARIVFQCSDGEKYIMYHSQDCCECVTIDDVNGDWQDLIGTPITMAYKGSSSDCGTIAGHEDSYTWTFYHIGTVKGVVSIRWFGSSNGYYSESVSFEKQ